jgi:hypothetical protein
MIIKRLTNGVYQVMATNYMKNFKRDFKSACEVTSKEDLEQFAQRMCISREKLDKIARKTLKKLNKVRKKKGMLPVDMDSKELAQ